ncbi:MAG TPA: hypothetical protein VNH53_09960 [Sphingomicrobium sp.]|jgi:hypothetical protein|nr:hypothetical protein [Sphingomicrobium sp.]
MASILLMSFLDVARSLGTEPLKATPERVCAFIKTEFARRGGAFNYNSSINALYDLFRGGSSLDDAEAYCMSHGAPAGFKPNVEAVRLAGAYAVANRSRCYKTPFSAVPVGRLSNDRTAYMAIKAPLVRVADEQAYVVVPGFRMGHRPIDTEIDVAASFALAHFGRDDFSEADFEYLYAGPGDGGRVLQVYHGRNRQIFDLDTVDSLLDIYVRGLELAVQQGAHAESPNFRGYKVIDDDQLGLRW